MLFSFFSYNKKSLVNVTVFLFVLIILFSMFALSIWFYNEMVDKTDLNYNKNDLQNVLEGAREMVILSASYTNVSINYSKNHISEEISLDFENSTILARSRSDSTLYVERVSTFGIPFCSSYTNIIAKGPLELFFNGSCVFVLV